MRADLRCEDARLMLSRRLDDDLTREEGARLDDHLSGCAACTEFAAALHEMRRTLRLEGMTAQVPDLVPAVMQRVAGPAVRQPKRELVRTRLQLAGAAAIVTALVLASTLVPGPDRPGTASASELSERILAAARDVTSYQATFRITERGWHERIPERTITASVAYSAPEHYRLLMTDLTEYPNESWPRNDVLLVATPQRWSITEPYSCPATVLPGCTAGSGVERRTILHRQPFDGSAPVPTDLILPLETLASAAGVDVIGTETIAGEETVHVALSYRQAYPLIGALQAGGSWAAIDPTARVDVWLEEDTLFPRRFTVTETPGEPAFEVELVSFDDDETRGADLFEVEASGIVRDGGFTDGEARKDIVPAFTADLDRYRTGRTAQGQDVLTYTDGVAWVKLLVEQERSPAPAVASGAEVVDLGDAGEAFYLPSSGESARRIDLFASEVHVRVETNLPRSDLERVAASLPVTGRAPTTVATAAGVLRRLDANEVATIGWASPPTNVPDGYELSAAVHSSDRQESLTLFYRDPQGALEESGVRIEQTQGISSLPPSSEDLFAVDVGGNDGRWSPERSELEWIEGFTYFAVAAPSFDLREVLAIAASLR